MAKALTKISLAHFKPGKTRREVPDGGAPGLYFVLQPSGSASWALRYRVAGTPRKLTLGSYPAIDLATARRLAAKAQGEIALSRDPAAEKQTAKAEARIAERRARIQGAAETNTVAHVADLFVARYAKGRNRSWKETARLLDKEVVKPWGDRPLASITRAEVHDLLDKIVDRPAPIVANRVLASFRRLCNWAVERGIIDTSPCEKIKAPAPERSRDRVLSDDEIELVWQAFDAEGYPFGDVGKLLLLTAARREEVAAMTWSEVDLERRVWTIDKERAKNGLIHEVPLSDAALAILRGVPRIDGEKGAPGYIFTTTGRTPVSGFSKTKERVDAALASGLRKEGAGEPEPWVLHDLRRTAASGMAGLGIAPHVVEAALNHKSGAIKGVAAVYNRYNYADEKRAALDAWARRLEAIVSGKSEGNVVEFAVARG